MDRRLLQSRQFDRERNRQHGPAAVFVLLKSGDGEGAALTVVRRVATGWNSKYSTFFGNTTFSVADTSEAMAADVRKSTHLVVVGSKITGLNGALHELVSETAPPDGDSPWWKIRALSVGRKFVPPEA